MANVFISYSRKDLDFVRKLAGDLERAGYDVWWDLSDLRGGDDWVNSIPAAIASGNYVIVVLTPDSVESQWVRKEYTQALSLRKKVIPILLKPVSMPFALNTINFVNFSNGEYADRFKELLSALDFTGSPPEVTPYRKALLSLPPAFRKFWIPVLVGVVILLGLLARAIFPSSPPPDPTSTVSSTPTISTPVRAPTDTVTVSPTGSPTLTLTPSPTTLVITETSTLTPTLTPTLPPALALPICIYGDARVNVREGPGAGYIPVAAIEANGTRCPFFSAYIRNRDQEIWFQLAPNQSMGFEQLGGRWIYQSGLAAADISLPPLPICIYSPGDTVEIHLLPGSNEDLLENTLTAEGSDCPFFDTRRQNEEGMWYRFAPNQKQKSEEFAQYGGAWIHEELLVVNTLNLPVIVLTPTSVPSATFTPSDTPTFTPSATVMPSETSTETPSPIATEVSSSP